LPPLKIDALKKLNEFVVQFVGLSNGNHTFNFEANTKFFELIKSNLINKGDVNVSLDLEKNNHTLTLRFNFEGSVDALCDRCSVDYAFPVKGEANLIVKTAGEVFEEEEDIITLPKGSSEIDLAQYIFDIIALSLPLKIVPCEINEDYRFCDQEVLKHIQSLEPQHDQEEIDPRWDILKQLKKK